MLHQCQMRAHTTMRCGHGAHIQENPTGEGYVLDQRLVVLQYRFVLACVEYTIFCVEGTVLVDANGKISILSTARLHERVRYVYGEVAERLKAVVC